MIKGDDHKPKPGEVEEIDKLIQDPEYGNDWPQIPTTPSLPKELDVNKLSITDPKKK